MRLHLIGVRYKNYRNFKDNFVHLSSKYEVKKLSDINSTIDEDNKLHLCIDEFEVEEIDDINSNISYVCVIGRNGTGKSTLIDYSMEEIADIHKITVSAKDILSYQIYIDEATKEIYFYINEKLVPFQEIKSITNIYKKNLYRYSDEDKSLAGVDCDKINNITVNYIDNCFGFQPNTFKRSFEYFNTSILSIKETINVMKYIELVGQSNFFKIETNETIDYFGDVSKMKACEIRDLFEKCKMENKYDVLVRITILSNIQHFKTIGNLDDNNVCDINNLVELGYENFFTETEKDYIKLFEEFEKVCLNSNSRWLMCKIIFPSEYLKDEINIRGKTMKIPKICLEFDATNDSKKEVKGIIKWCEMLYDLHSNAKDDMLSNIFNIELIDCSTGEQQMIDLMSHLYTGIKKIIQNKTGMENQQFNIILGLDEPDVYMHPEWSRRFKYMLDNLLKNIIKEYEANHKIFINFQVIITTHSPFIVSDFKKKEVIMLEKSSDGNGVCAKRPDKSFFGANIYDIIDDAFFLDSAIGEYAKKEIEEAVKSLKKGSVEKKDLDKYISLKNDVGDAFIKDYLNSLINICEVIDK